MPVVVARPHRQRVARGPRLVVLARARVRQRACRGVDLEQPRLVAAHDAVRRRQALGVRRRHRAQRYPGLAPVGVLLQREGVARLAEGRLGHVRHREPVGPLLVAPSPGGHVVGAAPLGGEGLTRVPALAPVVVRRAADQVAVRVVDAPKVGVRQGAGFCRRAFEVEPVGPARLQHDRKPVPVPAVVDLSRRPAAHRDRTRGGGVLGVGVPGRHVRHREPVGPLLVAPSPGGHVVGAAPLGGEGLTRVPALAPVVVRRAADQVAVRVVDAPKVGVRQGAGLCRRALEVEPVGPARLQHDRKPVPVPAVVDLSRRRTADRDRTRGGGVLGVGVPGRHVRHREPVGPLLVAPSPGGHVVGAAPLGGEGLTRVPALAPVVVRRAADQVAVRVVDAPKVGVRQGAGLCRRALEVEPVGPARLQHDRKPVPVPAVVDLSRRRTADPDLTRGIDTVRQVPVPLRNGRQRLIHVGDVDGDGHVAVQAAVARSRRQLVARGPRLMVLASARVRKRARRRVDLEQIRLVAAHDAVRQRRALGVRRRHIAQAHRGRAAVGVFRQLERVTRLGEGRRLRRRFFRLLT